jgi:hypothetical protein
MQPDEADYHREWDELYKRFSAPIDEASTALRNLTLKGLAGGLIAALTMVGAQLSQSGSLTIGVRLLAITFLVGLAFQMFRMWLIIEEQKKIRTYMMNYHDHDEMKVPPPIIEMAKQFCDVMSVLALALGGAQGIWLLLSWC